MIEIRTGNAEIGWKTWRVEITWQDRQNVFNYEAVQVFEREGKTTIEVDSTRLFAALEGEPLGVTDEELWATPYAQLQELALKIGLWLWTGIEPDRVEVEDLPLATTSGAGESPERSPTDQGSDPHKATADHTRSASGPVENPTSSMPPGASLAADNMGGIMTAPEERTRKEGT